MDKLSLLHVTGIRFRFIFKTALPVLETSLEIGLEKENNGETFKSLHAMGLSCQAVIRIDLFNLLQFRLFSFQAISLVVGITSQKSSLPLTVIILYFCSLIYERPKERSNNRFFW